MRNRLVVLGYVAVALVASVLAPVSGLSADASPVKAGALYTPPPCPDNAPTCPGD
jgi:hypothetical protein